MRSYFDWLPDDIVSIIIDRLNWYDVAKTSTVSHRFRDISRHAFPKLQHEKNLNLEGDTNAKIVDFVNHVLRTHEAPKVDSLRISLVGDVYNYKSIERTTELTSHRLINALKKKNEICTKVENDFNSWVRFAKAKCVESLELSRSGLDTNVPSPYPTFPMWDKLTALTLKSVPLDLGFMSDANINTLESLVLEDALASSTVIIRSSKLKRLEIRQGCLYAIEIVFAPNLECFKYVPLRFEDEPYKYISLMLHEVPKLSHINFTGGIMDSYSLLELQKGAGMLEQLELVVDSDMYTPNYFVDFSLLGDLKLNFPTINERCIPLLVFKNVLVACPKLHKLAIEYEGWNDFPGVKSYKISDCTHQYYLKEVELIGWGGDKNEDGVMVFLKQFAPNLERLSL